MAGDTEISSCYYSASHTDNISTDEHDSLRDAQPAPARGLHSSDSGADLSEYSHEDDWNRFWAQHGDKIIWQSWINKYRSYINPGYLESLSTTEQVSSAEPVLKPAIAGSKRNSLSDHVSFNFNVSVVEAGESTEEIASSDRPGQPTLDGWSQLSPVSVDCETEHERLLGSRCGSVASSTARTVGTTDSMTNVTRMTVSSVDFTDSSKSSDSLPSPISSIRSSDQSSSEDAADSLDPEHYWQELWAQHYHEQYVHNYNQFIAARSTYSADDTPTMRTLLKCTPESADSVGNMLEVMDMEDATEEDKSAGEGEQPKAEEKSDEQVQLGMYGLPLAFGKSKNNGTQGDENDSKKPRPVTVKRSHERDEDNGDQIKKAYSLIGLAYESNPPSKRNTKGQVVYKKKHIRLQNRNLNMNFKPRKPQHLYFDDDGNLITNPIDKVKLFLSSQADDMDPMNPMSVSSDDESNQLPSIHMNSGDSITPQTESTLVDEVVAAAGDCTPPDNADLSEHMSLDVDYEPETVTPARESWPPVSKRKEKKKKKRNYKLSNMPSEIRDNPSLMKYWFRRFSLFSKFDQGIKLDEESWFSVTPENVARYTAERCKCNLVVDAFCGAGGNAIQFALTCDRVIAIDIDPNKIELARHNAAIYGVIDRIEFVVADFFKVAENLKADVVYLSPPWGGPKYGKTDVYDLETMLQPVGITEMISTARKISPNIVAYLPRTSNIDQLVSLAGSSGSLEVEQNFLDKKLIALSAFYGDLCSRNTVIQDNSSPTL